jgi:hypothetical protein
MPSEEFCSRLDTFFGKLPKDFRYAVEIPNAGLLGPDYRKILENHGVAHIYNHWSYMPPLREQHHRVEELFTAPVTILRLLTPSKMPYETAKKRTEPYTKIVEELPEMRRGAVDLVTRAVAENRRAYVIVNNRSEGNVALTIRALQKALRDAETRALAVSICAFIDSKNNLFNLSADPTHTTGIVLTDVHGKRFLQANGKLPRTARVRGAFEMHALPVAWYLDGKGLATVPLHPKAIWIA